VSSVAESLEPKRVNLGLEGPMMNLSMASVGVHREDWPKAKTQPQASRLSPCFSASPPYSCSPEERQFVTYSLTSPSNMKWTPFRYERATLSRTPSLAPYPPTPLRPHYFNLPPRRLNVVLFSLRLPCLTFSWVQLNTPGVSVTCKVRIFWKSCRLHE
jgi:hypothetical protein